MEKNFKNMKKKKLSNFQGTKNVRNCMKNARMSMKNLRIPHILHTLPIF